MLIGLLKSSGPRQTSLRVAGLPARFARLASRFAVILMRESAATATTTWASAAVAARGALTLGPRLVDLEVAAAYFFSVESGNGLCCLSVIGHFHKSKTARPACLAISHDVNAPDLAKRLQQRRQIGLSGLKIQVSDKKTFHTISLAGYRPSWVQSFGRRNFLITNLPETCGRDLSAMGDAVCAVLWLQFGECAHALRRTPRRLPRGCVDCRPQTQTACV